MHPTSKQIRRWRIRLGMTQDQLARRVGVLQPVVSCWESGERVPSYARSLELLQTAAPLVEEARAMLTRELAHMARVARADGRDTNADA